MRLTPVASTRILITSSMIVRSKAPIRYITQSGIVVVWTGGEGGTGGVGGGGVGADGVAGNGTGTGSIIDVDAGKGTDRVGGDSVVKTPVALQSL